MVTWRFWSLSCHHGYLGLLYRADELLSERYLGDRVVS